MIEEPKLEVIVDEFGHATYRMSHNGFLLDKEQAEYVAERIKRLEQENEKLRELVRKYGEYIDQDHCEGCVCKSRCNDGYVDECWQLTEIRELASKLGIEVS